MNKSIDQINGTEAWLAGDEPVIALRDFYRGFNSRDLDRVSAHWSHAPGVSMSNPLGGVKRGWDEIRGVYEAIFHGPTQVFVEFHDIHIHGGHEYFIAVGRERGTARRDGETLELAIRTSRLFVRKDGAWRQYHHHGSMDDPERLAAYQRMIRGR